MILSLSSLSLKVLYSLYTNIRKMQVNRNTCDHQILKIDFPVIAYKKTGTLYVVQRT